MMTSQIVSLILHDDSLDRCVRFLVHHGSAACLLRAVNKGQKVTLRPNNLYHFVSVIETAVVIRLRLSETSRSGKMQTSLGILLVRS